MSPGQALKWPLLGVIRVYQVTFSGMMPNVCRFEPSCSRYSYEAIDRHGAFRGGWLMLRRLSRCRPGGGYGFDPVPGGENRRGGESGRAEIGEAEP